MKKLFPNVVTPHVSPGAYLQRGHRGCRDHAACGPRHCGAARQQGLWYPALPYGGLHSLNLPAELWETCRAQG